MTEGIPGYTDPWWPTALLSGLLVAAIIVIVVLAVTT